MTSPLSPRPGSTEEPSDWLVWSNEHSAWWCAKRQGYSTSLLGAGLYSKSEANEIAERSRGASYADRLPDLAMSLSEALRDERPNTAGALFDAQRAEIAELRTAMTRIAKSVDRAYSPVPFLPSEIADSVQFMREAYSAMCERLQLCVQRHHIGLGGEHVDDLVVAKLDELLSAAVSQERQDDR